MSIEQGEHTFEIEVLVSGETLRAMPQARHSQQVNPLQSRAIMKYRARKTAVRSLAWPRMT